jgi:hypothetical protein
VVLLLTDDQKQGRDEAWQFTKSHNPQLDHIGNHKKGSTSKLKRIGFTANKAFSGRLKERADAVALQRFRN